MAKIYNDFIKNEKNDKLIITECNSNLLPQQNLEEIKIKFNQNYSPSNFKLFFDYIFFIDHFNSFNKNELLESIIDSQNKVQKPKTLNDLNNVNIINIVNNIDDCKRAKTSLNKKSQKTYLDTNMNINKEISQFINLTKILTKFDFSSKSFNDILAYYERFKKKRFFLGY